MPKLPQSFPYSLAIAILYAGMAIATIAQPSNTIIWMQQTYGIHADAFVIALSLAAGVLMSRPSKEWFILCMIPLAFYMLMSVALAAGTQSPNVSVSVMYAVVIIVFPLAYKLCCINGVYLHHVYGVLIVGLSMALLSSPTAATLEFIQSQYGVLSIAAVAILLISAVTLLIAPSQVTLITMIALVMLYASVTAVIASQRGNGIGACINLILFVTMFYTIVKRRHYLANNV